MLDRAPHRELPLVLLIDDDLVSREVAATLLTLSGYIVHSAESGTEALAQLAGGVCHPGIVLVDAQMPGLSGVDLIRELRGSCADAQIYVISGSSPAEEIARAADGVLLKPFDSDDLGRILAGEASPVQSYLEDGDPVVSAEVLNKLRQMMPESGVREIFGAAVADLVGRIEALSTAIARGDGDEIRRIGHAIKGGCGMAGAMQAARLGALLEASPGGVNDNHLDNSSTLLRDLRAAAQALQRMLDAELPA